VPESLKSFATEPYSYAEAREVADALGLSEPVAVTLVRRGYRTPEQARAFLAADESHPAAAFEGMAEAVERVRGAIDGGRRITVHGDFDVDGVCATALMISTLRRLGADCDWLIPDRLGDGYGVSAANVERLAQRGTSLLITVDCGVTAVEEVALARQLGMEVIVTDHHQRAEELPDCLIVHPEISEYPFASLCGTAVAWKLSCALREGAGTEDLDLVALATVADLVPLVGENRALARQGLAQMRRVERVGLRALIKASKCEPTRLDEGDLAFRLAPRINAAGRLYRADAGVELLLTEDEGRAEEIAAELGRANAERRATEREVDTEAEAALRELPERLREAPGFVVAGEGWHPGVVGIVASRLVERHHRPVVVVSLDGDGGGRGSGRSIPGFDLLGALRACSEHLESFGGHRAAAGLSLRGESLEAFREAFAARAAELLGPEELRRTEKVDAMVGGVGLGLELAEELGQLAPFGMGNPGVRLLVPSAKVSDVRTMGDEGKHARFSLHSGSHRALGVAFGRSSLGVGEEDVLDATVRLEVNHWNGAVEPRVVLREVYPLREPVADSEAQATPTTHSCECDDDEWWRRFEAELGRDLGGESTLSTSGSPSRLDDESAATKNQAGAARRRVRSGGSAIAAIAELVSSGAGVLALSADASRRAELASGASGLARFNGGAALTACHRCGRAAVQGLAARGGSGLALTDYAALELAPDLARDFDHVVLVDPPSGPADEARAGVPRTGGDGSNQGATALATDVLPGFIHQLWSPADEAFWRGVLAARAPARETVASVYAALRDAGEVGGAQLRMALAGEGAYPRCPETAARCFRVLRELELVHGEPNPGAGSVGVVSSSRTELERSPAFRAYSEEHSEAERYLERRKKP
jgi:single-stranded-DNA-specific exonuclease